MGLGKMGGHPAATTWISLPLHISNSSSICGFRRQPSTENFSQPSTLGNQVGTKFGRIVLWIGIDWRSPSDFWCDVIPSRWRPWRHCSSGRASRLCTVPDVFSTFVPIL